MAENYNGVSNNADHVWRYKKEIAAEKVKVKQKKPKMTVAEAAAQIDKSYLKDFLDDTSAAFEHEENIQMRRFADFFRRAFSDVPTRKFQWVKFFRKPLSKTVNMPLCHISDDVYKISVDWINHRSTEALSFFVIYCLDSIRKDLKRQLTVAKGSKNYAARCSKRAVQQVAMFVGLAMVLRLKPDALISVLPTLREEKYEGQDKLPLLTWMVAQASIGDLSVGLYAWSQNFLPIVVGKSGNPQSMDFVLQLVEKILSNPKALPVLVYGAVRKGEQLIPAPAFETLIRVTFPSSNRVKATERFAVVYPILRKLALCGSHGYKAIKPIFNFAIKAAGEDNPELSKEAVGIVIWCFCRSTRCYNRWKKVYKDNIVGSVAVLKKISDNWKVQATKLSPYEPLGEILKHFRQKNERALATETDAAHHAHFKDADKYCKIIAGRISQGLWCKAASLTFAVLAAAAVLYSQLE